MIQLNEENIVEYELKNRGSDISVSQFDFYDKNINDIKPEILDNYKLLRDFFFQNNKVTKIPQGLFRHLLELEKVNLDNNLIQTIDSNIFEFNQKLNSIYLQSNKIQFIPANIFHSLPELRHISLSYNQIKAIDSDTFAFNQKLEIIKLHNNQIELLPAGAFDNLPKLEELHLDGNKLTSFDFNSLKDSPKLTMLHLYNNRLLEIVNFNMHKILWKDISEISLKKNNLLCAKTLYGKCDRKIVHFDDNDENLEQCAVHGKLNLLFDMNKTGLERIEKQANEKDLELQRVTKELTGALQEVKEQMILAVQGQNSKYEELKKDMLMQRKEMMNILIEINTKLDSYY